MSKERELRSLPLQELRIAKGPDGTRTLEGMAIVFNARSQDLGGFQEVVSPEAVRDTLSSGSNVLLLNNHNTSQVLGSTRSGTMTLTTTAKGVSFRCQLDTRQSYANDLAISIERGDTAGCSFGFYTNKDSWQEDNGTAIRTLESIDITELTVCASPAYLQTTTSIRSCPAELRSLLKGSKRDIEDDEDCDCDCPECVAGDCADCTNPEFNHELDESERSRMQLKIELAKRR